MKPHLRSFRKIKMVTVDTAFYSLGLDPDFEKQEEVNDEFGAAVCLSKLSTDEPPEMEGADKNALDKKKTVYVAKWMPSWESDVAGFLEECNSGSKNDWFKLARKPHVRARPSETKHVKAPARKKEGEDAEKGAADEKEAFDGTKKGKEYIGRRKEEEPVEEEEEEEDDGAEEEEEVEEEEL